MTQINKGQARANEVHARNDQKYLEKHGHPRPGKGKKSQVSTGTGVESTGKTTGTNTGASGVSGISGYSPTGTQSSQTSGSTSSQNIARARPTGGPNDTVAYLEGAIDNVINVQDTYNKTYY